MALTGSQFSGGFRGIVIAGQEVAPQVRIEGATFSNHSGPAVKVSGKAGLVLRDSRIVDSGDGVFVDLQDSGASVLVERTTFLRNTHNVIIRQLLEATGYNTITLTGSHLGPLQGEPGKPTGWTLEGVSVAVVSHQGLSDPLTTTVLLEGNTITGASKGLFLNGGGFSLTSSKNHFVGNTVGVHSATSHAVFSGDTLESTVYDFVLSDHGNRLVLENERFDRRKVHIMEGAGVIETENGDITRETMIALAAGGSITLLTVLTVFSHAFRDGLIRFLFIPLYARLSPAQVLAHDKRKDIVNYLGENPGAHLRAIGRALDLTYGTLTYHLYRLEREGIIVPDEDGLFKKYYLSAGRQRNAKEERPATDTLRKTEREIYDDILAHPGSPQSEVAARLGLSRQALHYHIKKLETQGFISKVAQGRETLCYAKSDAEAGSEVSPLPKAEG